MAEDEKENWIERNSKTITTLATVSIPIVLAVIGYFANAQISKQQLDQEYVNLAIGILRAETNVDEAQTCKTQFESIDEDSAKEVAEKVEDDEKLRDLPKTLFRKWALDLLLESTPEAVQLTPTQYKGLLCGEKLAALTPEDDVTPTEIDDQPDAESVLFQRLEKEQGDDSIKCLIVSSDTPTVGGLTLGPGEYLVTKTVELPTDESDQEPAALEYVNISLDKSVWVLVGPTAQPSPDQCAPPTTTGD